MKKKTRIVVIAAVVLLAAVVAGRTVLKKKAAPEFVTTALTRGDLESTITASGTLSPLTTVDVGTQVSGTLAKVFVDFNDHVKKGQLMAVIDTLVLKTSELDAEAGVEKARAQLNQAMADFNRQNDLYKQKLIADADYLQAKYNVDLQRANLKSAKAGLERAERNLRNAYIYAPISGTVIQRNVEAGQTVAASFSTPTLFVLARDLSQMEILIDVDEGDIGQVKVGQQIRFQVQAYPDDNFKGTVTQIRLQPETISNVVNYTVVAQADNENGLLLPGMTATVDFIISQANNVLRVPNTALRFQPPAELLKEFRARRVHEEKPGTAAGTGNGTLNGNPGAGPFPGASGGPAGHSSQSGRRRGSHVWYLDDRGQLEIAPLKAGMSDGKYTEVLGSPVLKEGMKVVTGVKSDGDNSDTQRNGFRMRRPPF